MASGRSHIFKTNHESTRCHNCGACHYCFLVLQHSCSVVGSMQYGSACLPPTHSLEFSLDPCQSPWNLSLRRGGFSTTCRGLISCWQPPPPTGAGKVAAHCRPHRQHFCKAALAIFVNKQHFCLQQRYNTISCQHQQGRPLATGGGTSQPKLSGFPLVPPRGHTVRPLLSFKDMQERHIQCQTHHVCNSTMVVSLTVQQYDHSINHSILESSNRLPFLCNTSIFCAFGSTLPSSYFVVFQKECTHVLRNQADSDHRVLTQVEKILDHASILLQV